MHNTASFDYPCRACGSEHAGVRMYSLCQHAVHTLSTAPAVRLGQDLICVRNAIDVQTGWLDAFRHHV
jgi:hypothetical protein